MLNLDDAERGSQQRVVNVPETHALEELLEELSGARLRPTAAGDVLS